MQKIDFKKELKKYYNASSKAPEIVEVPAMNFFMIDGEGDPNTSQDYKDSIEALYTVSYTIKFSIKKSALAIDYGVLPLEGLWWMDDMNQFSSANKNLWKWTSMIMQPELVTKEMVEKAIKEVEKKKTLPALSKIRFEKFNEGKCAQIMHIGPYAAEEPTIKSLHEFIKSNGGKFSGEKQKHHEIYLSDPRKSTPEKLKTIIRQPMV
ncbi:MAG: GyrI-like domain-containing protein [Ignavibacteriales bacterium]|nr:GyrI-like domain-containing protein [Ignavibacteriales bacterium]